MRKLVKGLFGLVGSAIGWNIAAPAGGVASAVAAIIGLAIGIYLANRLFLTVYG
jgi:hypothetical protein